MKERIEDYIDSFELSFKIKDLLFQDIMSAASNRFSPDFLYNLFNADEAAFRDKDISDSSSEKSEFAQL